MKTMRINRITAVFTALIMTMTLSMPVLAEVADPSYIEISSVDEFTEVASKCSLDTWSENKTIKLINDLDLSKTNFNSIPIFSGIFDGNGHRIIGVELVSSGSNQGFFRYVQDGGVIKNLSVVGTITPEGSKCNVGGIVGNNSGTLQNCSFAGIVSGETSIGGIVGLNNESGVITECSAIGTVSGKKNTGGISGKNLGSIIKCVANTSVNTTSSDAKVSLDNLDLDLNSAIEDITSFSKDDENDKTLTSHTDTGGIAGYSSGIIQGCKNTGTIGYQHMGYNVGGIVGRQSGYMAGCTNDGIVYGRKDVGGIVGQTEPYIIMNFSEDVLTRLQNELDKLKGLINNSLDTVETTSDNISTHLTSISGYADSARDSTKSLADKTSDFMDNNIDEVNDIGAEISNSLDKMQGILDDAESSTDTITKALKKMKTALNTMEDAVDSGSDAINNTEKAMDKLITANGHVKDAVSDLNDAIKELNDAIVLNGADSQQANVAAEKIASEDGKISKLQNALAETSDAISGLPENLKDSGLFDSLGLGDAEDIIKQIEDIKTSLDNINSALKLVSDKLLPILENISIDPEKVQESIQKFSSAFDNLKEAMSSGSEALTKLNDVLGNLDDGSDSLGDSIGKMSDAMGAMSKSAGYLTDSVSGLKDLVTDLADKDPIKFEKLGDDVRMTGDELYASLNNLSQEVSDLNNTVNESSKELINNVRAINNQFNKVMDVVISAITDISIKDNKDDISDFIQDTSDENINSTKLGKVTDCNNTGEIQADKNVGGVVGSMDIEYDVDPEEDLTGNNIFRTTYETKAVLVKCINEGKIIGKKDCIGGVVGRMNLGTVVECENYGSAESTDGDYIGGISGKSTSVIRNSYSKSSLKGNSYVGGIAGSGSKIYDCYTIVSIDAADECVGAIAGSASSKNEYIDNNYFVSDTLAGIDGISYSGKAEPMEFNDFASLKHIPDKFRSFKITFVADDETIQSLFVGYGEKLYDIELPEVPKKDGYYGKWPDFITEDVTEDMVAVAEYTPWIKVVASDETQNDSMKSLALAEGQFTDDAVLKVVESSHSAPSDAINSEFVTVWDVSLKGTELSSSDNVALRLLNEGNGKAQVWQINDGEWKKVDYNANGQYLKLDMQGTDSTFCIASNGEDYQIKHIIGICILGLASIVFVFKKIKERRVKRAVNSK